MSAGSRTGRGPATRPRTCRPFHVTRSTPAGAQTVSAVGESVSPVSASVRPATDAVRARYGPRTSAGPAAVSSRHRRDSAASSPRSSVSGVRPPPDTDTRVSVPAAASTRRMPVEASNADVAWPLTTRTTGAES